MRRLPPLPEPPMVADSPSRRPDSVTAAAADAVGLGPCPLCGRPMVEGPSLDRHHWVPRSEGGREQSLLHRICHRKIHSVLDERSLARAYATPDALRSHPEIARFLRWVARKPPEFMDRHRRARR
ncbi:hypothetical protein GCM10009099_35770 [Caenispirillum bisanense]